MDEGVEGFVAFAVVLGLPGTDGPHALEACDDALFGELAQVVGGEASWNVDRAGAGFGQAQAGLSGVHNRVYAEDEDRDLVLVRSGGTDQPLSFLGQ